MMVLIVWLWMIVWLLLMISVLMIAGIMTVVVAAICAAVVRCVSTATCGIINVIVGNNVAIAVFIKVNGIATVTAGNTSTNTTGHIHWYDIFVAADINAAIVVVVVVIVANADIATAGCGFDLRSVNVERIKYQHMVIVLGQSDHITFGCYLQATAT